MPIVILVIAWLGGIWLGHALWQAGLTGCATPGWPAAVLAAALAGATAAALARRATAAARGASAPDRLYLLCPAVAFMIVTGAWRYQATPLAACAGPGDLSYYHTGRQEAVWATVEGTVSAYPEGRDSRTDYRVEAVSVTVGGQVRAVHGLLLVRAPLFPAARYGDRVQVVGLLAEPPVFADFDYRAYLARQGIHSLFRNARLTVVGHGGGSPLMSALYALRQAGSDVLGRSLPEPAAALAQGMLLGLEGGIPRDVNEAFKRTGTSHVIVISGSNISLLSGFLLAFLTRVLGRRRAWPVAASGVVLYVLLAGAEPAAVRAGIMGILYILGSAAGRQNTPLAGLGAAALLMTALDPRLAWDVGFQLSFVATLGMILFVLPLRGLLARWCGRALRHPWLAAPAAMASDLIAPTLAAQIMVLPLQLGYFGSVSPVSLLANFLILPVQPAILAGGMLSLVAGLIWLPLGQALAAVPWLFLTYTTEVVRLTAGLPVAAAEAAPWARTLIPAYYGVLFAAAGYRALARGARIRLPAFGPTGTRRAAWAAGLALPLVVLAGAAAARPDGRLHIFYLSAKGGEAALVVGPDGTGAFQWDGRGEAASLAAAARARLHTVTGRVDAVLGPPAAAGLWPEAAHIDLAGLETGQTVRLGGSVDLTRVAAGAEPVLALRSGDFRTLLPATIGQGTQAALAEAGIGPLAVLKLPGPGTGAWPAQAFLVQTSPRMILWPHGTTYPPGVSDWLERSNATRVDEAATLEVVTDGKEMWVREWSEMGSR